MQFPLPLQNSGQDLNTLFALSPVEQSSVLTLLLHLQKPEGRQTPLLEHLFGQVAILLTIKLGLDSEQSAPE